MKKGGTVAGAAFNCERAERAERASCAGAQAMVSSTSMLPRVAFEYGHTW